VDSQDLFDEQLTAYHAVRPSAQTKMELPCLRNILYRIVSVILNRVFFLLISAPISFVERPTKREATKMFSDGDRGQAAGNESGEGVSGGGGSTGSSAGPT